MKPFDNSEREIDSIFHIKPSDIGAQLILESRGGAKNAPRLPRNADYARGLELLLRRLGEQKAVLVDIEVLSNRTKDWPISQRRIVAHGFPMPLDLATLDDIAAFRHQVGQASAALGRLPERKSGGNPTKRLCLTLRWPSAVGLPAHELEALLSDPRPKDDLSGRKTAYEPLGSYLRQRTENEVRLRMSEISTLIGRTLPKEAWTLQFWANTRDHHWSRRGQWLGAGYLAKFEKRTETVVFTRRHADVSLEVPTDDPDKLRSRAKSARRKMSAASGNRPPAQPPGSSTVDRSRVVVTRFVRDPNVIGWVLNVANSNCEVCGNRAPFDDDDGEPFLEVHHVRPLGEGGPDQVDNAVAACPNCHRRLHMGANRDTLRIAVIGQIGRLRNYPARITIEGDIPDHAPDDPGVPPIVASQRRPARTD